MNKRIKEKWSRIEELETKVAQLMAENRLLMDAIRRQTGMIEEMNAVNSRNAQAANNRFEALENKINVLQNKQSKKSWFGHR